MTDDYVYVFNLKGGHDVRKAEIYERPRQSDAINIALTEEQALQLIERMLTEIEWQQNYG